MFLMYICDQKHLLVSETATNAHLLIVLQNFMMPKMLSILFLVSHGLSVISL